MNVIKALKEQDPLLLSLETAASITTLLGVYYGTTTICGSSWYAFSLIFWHALTFKRQLWGLLPLNIGTTVIAGINLYHALIG